jgi:hypothetical protein
MFSCRPSRRWLQFRLQTLLLGTLIAAVACCWFTPFVREVRRADGTLEARYRLRREWNGALTAAGEQWEFYNNGKPERRWIQNLGAPGAECDGTNCTHWDAEGRQLTPGEGQFHHLIWLITHTIQPDAWTDCEGQGLITTFDAGCRLIVEEESDFVDEGGVTECDDADTSASLEIDLTDPFR